VADFTEPGVNIRTDSNVNSAVAGLGNPGDGFRVDEGHISWYRGQNLRTQVAGWVYVDYLVGPEVG
jgi:hypothetical protein